MNTPGNVQERVRVLAQRARDARKLWEQDCRARDSAIWEASCAGHGLREIARMTGEAKEDRMSVGHVQRIVADQAAAYQERIREHTP